MKASEALSKARKLFRGGRGWIQNTSRHKTSTGQLRFCSTGALTEAVGYKGYDTVVNNSGTYTRAFKFLQKSINARIFPASIVSFNDARNRKYKSIDLLFRKAEKLAIAAGD